MMKANSSWWQPPHETLDAIAAVLMSHWRAAAAHPQRVFWPRPGEWLRGAALTTSLAAADSSDKLPGLHPC